MEVPQLGSICTDPCSGVLSLPKVFIIEDLVPLAFSHQGLRLLLLGAGTLTFSTVETPSSQSRIRYAAEVMKGLGLVARNVL